MRMFPSRGLQCGAVLGLLVLGCASGDDDRPAAAGCEDPADCAPAQTVGSIGGGGGGPPSTGGGGAPTGVGGSPGLACNAASGTIGVSVGEVFPDLEFVACDNTRITFDDIRCGANVTLLSIGAGWCEPCREEAPALEALHQEIESQGGQVVQVMFEDADGAPATTLFCERWRDELALTLPVFVDPVRRTLGHFDGSLAPFNLVLDRDGNVLAEETGTILDATFEAAVRAAGADAAP